MRSRLVRWFFGFVVLSAAFAACLDTNLVNNPSFDLWCGESLCGWQVDAGSIERVGTWHRKDYGVSFEGTSTQISQLSEADPVQCMRFDMIADADPKAQLSVVLDFNDDGIEDFTQRITDVRWKSVQFIVRPPRDYRNVRYILRKQSEGRAVIAQLRVVEETEDCAGPPMLLQDGARCTVDAACRSGLCSAGLCSACASLGSCGEGEGCHLDSQCADGVCSGGTCQRCASDGTCPALAPCDRDDQCQSSACRPRLTFSNVADATNCLRGDPEASGSGLDECSEGVCLLCAADPFPRQCAECTADEQCASGVCEQGLCADCRSDDQCPAGQTCRYRDLFDVGARACTAEVRRDLPRGALCETSEECSGGLACGSTSDEAKRCGIACEVTGACVTGSICTRAAFSEVDNVIWYPERMLPAFANVASRIATCHAVLPAGAACTLHAECGTGVCCGGACMSLVRADKNLRTGGCTLAEDNADWE